MSMPNCAATASMRAFGPTRIGLSRPICAGLHGAAQRTLVAGVRHRAGRRRRAPCSARSGVRTSGVCWLHGMDRCVSVLHASAPGAAERLDRRGRRGAAASLGAGRALTLDFLRGASAPTQRSGGAFRAAGRTAAGEDLLDLRQPLRALPARRLRRLRQCGGWPPAAPCGCAASAGSIFGMAASAASRSSIRLKYCSRSICLKACSVSALVLGADLAQLVEGALVHALARPCRCRPARGSRPRAAPPSARRALSSAMRCWMKAARSGSMPGRWRGGSSLALSPSIACSTGEP